jgi:hypothetical protein
MRLPLFQRRFKPRERSNISAAARGMVLLLRPVVVRGGRAQGLAMPALLSTRPPAGRSGGGGGNMSAPLANAVPWSREGSLAHPHRVPGDRLGGEPALQEGAHRDRMPACLAALRAAHAGAENADSAKRLGGVVTRGAIDANGTHTESAREAGAPMRRPSADRRRTRRSWRSPRSTPTTSGPKCPLRWPLRPAVPSGRPSRRSATGRPWRACCAA